MLIVAGQGPGVAALGLQGWLNLVLAVREGPDASGVGGKAEPRQ